MMELKVSVSVPVLFWALSDVAFLPFLLFFPVVAAFSVVCLRSGGCGVMSWEAPRAGLAEESGCYPEI